MVAGRVCLPWSPSGVTSESSTAYRGNAIYLRCQLIHHIKIFPIAIGILAFRKKKSYNKGAMCGVSRCVWRGFSVYRERGVSAPRSCFLRPNDVIHAFSPITTALGQIFEIFFKECRGRWKESSFHLPLFFCYCGGARGPCDFLRRKNLTTKFFCAIISSR